MYKDMGKILKDKELGNFKISHFKIEENDFYAKISGIPTGKYIKLTHGDEIVMSNTPMEKSTNMEFIQKAHGNVLIAGLGIGLIVLAIQDNQNIDKITIIEKNKEVIDLVKPQLPLNSKVEIVNEDIFTYKPSMKYNTIYFDIWNYINSDVYEEEMKPLISKYRKYLVPKKEDENRYIDCWCKKQAKNNMRI